MSNGLGKGLLSLQSAAEYLDISVRQLSRLRKVPGFPKPLVLMKGKDEMQAKKYWTPVSLDKWIASLEEQEDQT